MEATYAEIEAAYSSAMQGYCRPTAMFLTVDALQAIYHRLKDWRGWQRFKNDNLMGDISQLDPARLPQ